MHVKRSLQKRVLHASAWTFSGHFVGQLIRFGSNLIMTRLLVPEMFGIMVLANVILIGLQLFSDLGLRQNIVQHRRGDTQEFLNTVWTVQIIRGVVIYMVALLGALSLVLLQQLRWLPISSVYAEPILPTVIAILSINAIISGFEPTKIALASRNIALGKLTQMDLASQTAGIVFMVAWALVDRSIWALVCGSFVTSTLRVVLGNLMLPGISNRTYWDKNIARDIFSFGKWIFLSSILGFLSANGDKIILGSLVDSRMLGLYSIAFFLASALRDVVSKIIANVAFPALSEIARERPQDLKQTYYRLRRPIDIATLLATGILFFAGHLIILVFYDSRYTAAGPMLEVLSIMLFEVRYTLAAQCFMALGKPKLLIPVISTQLTALYALMPLAFAWYGVDGAIWVAGGSVLVKLPVVFYLKFKLDLLDIKKELCALFWLFLGLGIGWAIKSSTVDFHAIHNLPS